MFNIASALEENMSCVTALDNIWALTSVTRRGGGGDDKGGGGFRKKQDSYQMFCFTWLMILCHFISNTDTEQR